MLEKELEMLSSFDAADDILKGIRLHPLQIADVLKMVYSKRCIVRYDTGTGKTLLAAAALRMLWNENPKRRFMMFVKKDQSIQTPKKLEQALGVPVLFSCAAAKDVQEKIYSKQYLKYPLVLLTHECLKNQKIMRELFSERDKFDGVVVDEAHVVNNVGYAHCADVMEGLLANFEFCFALTATPILTSALQFAKLLTLVRPDMFSNPKKLARDIEHGRFRVADYPLVILNRSDRELGRKSEYRGHLVWVEPTAEQLVAEGQDLIAVCKGPGATPQALELARLIKSQGKRRGLIYIRQHKIREWVLPFLDKFGIRYECINGGVVDERPAILKRFNEDRDLDVLITSVTTAIDCDCDYVVFYEFTVELKQMIGRADRGLDGKVVDVYYLLTKDTGEPDYFAEKIVSRSDMIQRTLGIEYQELECAEGLNQ